MSGTIGEGPTGEKRREIPYLGAIKIASVVMGIMIVVGVAVIGVTIAKRLSGAGEQAATTEPVAASVAASIPAAAPTPFADRDIAIPEGASVVRTAIDGRRLAVTLRLLDGRTAVLLMDARTGERLGLLTLTPTAP